MRLAGAVAVVTGGASGIGRAVALSLASRGANLALTDRDEAGLAHVAQLASVHGTRVSRHVMDVTDAAAVAALPDAVLAEHGRVSVLVNNAGATLLGSIAEVSVAEMRWLLEVNLLAVVSHTRAFLPLLQAEQAGHIVNVSSVFGLIAPPRQAAYAATKFAVRGFTESLRHELAGSPVAVSVVHPGGIRTAIARNARRAEAADRDQAAADREQFDKRLGVTPPEVVAEAIVRAVERGSPRVLVGRFARAGDLAARLAPGRYWQLLGRLVG